MTEINPEGSPKFTQEFLANPRAYVESTLQEFLDSLPKFPIDPEEQSRRLGLLQQDPRYLELANRYKSSSGQNKLDIAVEMSVRRYDICTNPNPETLIEKAKAELE